MDRLVNCCLCLGLDWVGLIWAVLWWKGRGAGGGGTMRRNRQRWRIDGGKRKTKLTALLDALRGRIADGLVDGLDLILDRGPGILLRVRARGEADRFAGGS